MGKGGSGGSISTGDIVNVGKFAWSIFKDGRPASAAKSAFCSAIPKTVERSTIRGYRRRSARWSFVVENWFSMDVIDCAFVLDFQYGGFPPEMPNAKFLDNVRVTPGRSSVSWGFRFDADASVSGRPTYSGGQDNPVSELALDVRCSVNSGTTAGSYTYRLIIRGDGSWSGRGG